MLSEFTFLRIYKSLANGKAETKEILGLYFDLQAILGEDTPFAKWFKEESPDRLGAAIAIDAVAHAIHQEGEDILHQIFPDAVYSIIKSELDKLAGLEKNNQIRQYNRGYFTTLLAEDSVFLLEKQLTQVGRTTREAILPAIKEYEKLYKAGLSSPAEILTLSRYYPDNEQYRLSIIKLGLDNEENHPVVVGGPASVEMIDREGHLITTEALDKAFTKFMANFRTRDINILHSDVQVGWVLPAYLTKDGRVFSSGVDDKQLWVLSELRGDTRIAKRVAQEILDKNLRSYSIAGSALDVQDMQKGANSYKSVNELELSEITLCFVAKSSVWTKVGLKNIEEVNIGDFVYTHLNRYKPVTDVFERNYSGKILRVKIDCGFSFASTPGHPILCADKWIAARNLKVGDLISSNFLGIEEHRNADGSMKFSDTVLSKIISIEENDYVGKVYNLEIAEDNSYSMAACIAHNCERGMNSQANFDLIKSVDSTPSFDSILASFQDELSPFSGAQIYVENSGEIPSVIIKADKYNSIIDMLVLELQKMLPKNTPVIVKYDVSDAIPVYKMQLVPIWTTPQTQREADHSFPAKLGEDILAKDAEEGTPPREGLVPQSGDFYHPDRWVRPEYETSSVSPAYTSEATSVVETKHPKVLRLERGMLMNEQTVKTNYLRRRSSGLSQVLQKAIIESRIPSSHLDGVFIKVTTEKTLPKTTNAPYGAAGRYNIENQRIQVASGAKSHTPIHEIGHHAYHTIFKDLYFDIWHIYSAAKDSGKGFPSEYAKKNESEFFAECYLAYIKNPEALRKKNAPMAELLEKLW